MLANLQQDDHQMKKHQLFLDKLAIGFSSICILHCLALPLIVIIVPATTHELVEHSWFHLLMLFAVIPTSLLAIILGYKRHRSLQVIIIGLSGMLILIFAAFNVDHSISETAERIVTAIGSITIAFAHFKNFKFCQSNHLDPRPDTKEN